MEFRLNAVKSALYLYRIVALLVLYGFLAGIFSYIFIWGFFAVNSSWAAPVIITPTSDKILDLTGKIVSSEQALQNLVIERDRLTASLDDMKRVKAQLDTLSANLEHAISVQRTGNKQDVPELGALNVQKQIDNVTTKQRLQEIAGVEERINSDLKAGLITKSDASAALVQLNRLRLDYTDGQISEVLLRANIRQKAENGADESDLLSKDAELKNNIFQLWIQIKSGEEQLQSDITQIASLRNAINTAKTSPYYLATQGNVSFAFVPYGNQSAAKQGSPVYDCYLKMIACRKVGTVERVFADEEHITHPIFKTDLRGFMVQLNLSNKEAAKSSVLFMGRRPLLF